MDRNFAAIAIFTLLFAVSTARISLDPTPTNLHVAHSSFHRQPDCALEDSNLRFVSSGMKQKPVSDGILESNRGRDVKVDLTPRSDFARFHAINRHFFNEPRVPIHSVHTRTPQNPFLKPRSKISHENEETIKVHAETTQGQALSKWSKFKHDYQHERYQHHHHQHQQHHHIGNNNNVVSLRKHKFVGMKMNSLANQQKAKTRVPEAGLMTSIRKFMKHSFE